MCMAAGQPFDPDNISIGVPDIVAGHPDVDVVGLDPLTAFENVNLRNVRQRLAPFHRLAEERGVTFFIPHHTTKSRSARNPLGLISGSKSWTDNCPMVWQIEQCNQNGDAILEMTKGRRIPRPWPR